MEVRQLQQIRDLAITTGKINAIKHVMATQGLRLLPAKQLVDLVLVGLPTSLLTQGHSKPTFTASARNRRMAYWPYVAIGALLFISLCCFTGSYRVAASHEQLARDGDRVQASVVGLQWAGKRCHAPILEYEFNGETLSHVSSISSNPPSYKVGDSVTMFISGADSNHFLIDDFAHRWFVPIMLGGMGLATLLPVGIIYFLFVGSQ